MTRFFILALCVHIGIHFSWGQTAYHVTLFGHINKYGANPLSSNYSEVWGWTDTVKHREYAFIGSPQGTSVVDITEAPIQEVSFLIGPPSGYNYHEFRTYQHYLYIGAEGSDIAKRAGIQIIDLSTLPEAATFKKVFVWEDTNSTTNAVRKYYRAHTVSIEGKYLYVNGGDFGGIRVMDLTDPLNPLQVGSYGKGSTPYVHDSFVRNDTVYAAAINSGRVDIVDFTTKGHYTQNSSGVISSKTSTVPEGRTHHVWLSDDSRYMFVATEIGGGNLHIYDNSDRTNPVEIATWTSNPSASIHNIFVKGDFLYIAYYTEGVRILDISNPSVPIEVGFYQTYTDPNPTTLWAGAWGAYPYFPSGKVAISDMNTGLYIFTVDEKKGGRVAGTITDAATQLPLSGVNVLVEEMGRSVNTSQQGEFIYGSAEGKHTVTFSKSGYIARTETVATLPGTIDTVTFALMPNTALSVIHQQHAVPEDFHLSQNFPNPFNPSTTITFSLPEQQQTTLSVLNSIGQEITTLVRQSLPAGSYSVTFNAASLSSGVYFYTLRSGNNLSTKKMTLIR